MSVALKRLSVQVSPQELDLWKKIASIPHVQETLGGKVRTSQSGLVADLANYGALVAQKQHTRNTMLLREKNFAVNQQPAQSE